MTESRELLKKIQLFVLDMDGTFYLGERRLDGSLEFLKAVEMAGKRFLFLTNNSSRAPEDYIKKLAGMDCPIARSQLVTSGDVMVRYLKTHYPGKTVYLMGTKALEKSFREAKIPLTEGRPDIVVAGFDTELTYHKLERACTYIREGAVFLATHMDINCPVEGGFIPDCGAMCAAISLSTGKKPKYVGKPFRETVDIVEALTGIAREGLAFVGDRIYTDVAAGVNNGAAGILVLSGETRLSDVAHSPVKPDAIYASLGEIAGDLQLMQIG